MILLYHKVHPESKTQWWVDVERFHRDLLALRSRQVVFLDDYDPSNADHAVITFDGIYQNVLTFAAPLLQDFGYPFELFLSGDHVGLSNEFDTIEPPAPFVDESGLRKLVSMGGRLQWHSRSHVDLRGLESIAQIERELTIPDHLRALDPDGFNWFAYPHGEFDERVLKATRQRFRGGVSCNQGNDQDLFELNRLTVTPQTPELARPTIAVIVASYNYGRFLIEAVESVLGQSQLPDEIHLVDDYSDDETPEICAALEQVHPGRFKVHRNEKNLGIEANFNAAVRRTQSDYVCILGADNRIQANYIEALSGVLDRHSDVAVAYSDFALFGNRARLVFKNFLPEQRGRTVSDRFYIVNFPDFTAESAESLRERNFIHGSSMFRRQAFDQVGGYADRESGPEDHQLFLAMVKRGWQAKRCATAMLEYRQHSRGQANEQLSSSAALRLFQVQAREAIAKAESLSGQLVDIQNQLHAKEHELASTSSELEASIETIAALRGSLSWRITAPIRLVKHIAAGRFPLVRVMMRDKLTATIDKLPLGKSRIAIANGAAAIKRLGLHNNSGANEPALTALVTERNSMGPVSQWPILGYSGKLNEEMPIRIDISAVTFNSERWIKSFTKSLLACAYPMQMIRLVFVDHGSTDNTIEQIHLALEQMRQAGADAELITQNNLGYGAGHDAAIQTGSADFLLITNVDLEFEPGSLQEVVSRASTDELDAAAWEFRQKPFEHPKHYDPLTGSTNWNSHACVLIRRKAYQTVGGYDQNIFMYGEDVELSYALRRSGYKLRYCPNAVVWHHSYEDGVTVKPHQYVGSTFANLYLRLIYGQAGDLASVPLMALRLLASSEPFPGARSRVLRHLGRLIKLAPAALGKRRTSMASFPFRNWDYELTREGAFVEAQPIESPTPLISVITRTFQGRDYYLAQAIASVLNQTWPNIEHIIVEDGDETQRRLVESSPTRPGYERRFITSQGNGRSAAGNTGLAQATGHWCLFLDDDDLLMPDHLETLAAALKRNADAVASYSLAWEVSTETDENSDGKYTETSYQLPEVFRQEFDFETLTHHNYLPIQSVLFEHSLFAQRGGFHEDMHALEDWLLWVKFAQNNQFVHVPKVTSLYRVPAKQEISGPRKRALNDAYPKALIRVRTLLGQEYAAVRPGTTEPVT